jgi:radical SAM superfamily enzyme YgiQ (UPF0313 family)
MPGLPILAELPPRKSPGISSPKVLLVRPPQLFYFGVWPRGPRLSLPIGLLSIGSFLKKNGVSTEIYDCFVEGTSFQGEEFSLAAQQNNQNLIDQWIRRAEAGAATHSEAQNRNKKQHFGADWRQIREDLEIKKPDVVGITNLFRENTEETLKTAALVREVLPQATIIVGGPNANALPEYMLERSPAIDFIGLGDGELTLLRLVEWVEGKRDFADVGGLVYRHGSSYERTEKNPLVSELDEFGHIDYSMVRLGRYFSYERNGIMARNKFSYAGADRSVSLVTSRGCPYKCSFCSIHIHAGRKYRRYSVEHTLAHLETLVKELGVRHIHFEDDNLTLDRDRFDRLMDGILERGLKFTWDTPNGVFANTLDEEMLAKMKKTGCIYLIIGVESGVQEVLDNVIMKQPLTIEHVKRAFSLGARVGLDIHAFYIIGFPRESLAQIQETLTFALENLRKYDVIPHMALARADPGTALFQEAKESGTLLSDYALVNTGGVHSDYFVRHAITTKEFSPETLEALNREFHRQAIRIVAFKTGKFLLKHPLIALKSMLYFLRSLLRDHGSLKDSVVKLFFCRLFYRNALLMRRA